MKIKDMSQLKNTIKPLCPVLMKGVVENFNSKTLAAI